MSELAMYGRLVLAMPPIVRRARMVAAGVPRHLYKFRAIPQEPELRARLEGMLLENQLFGATADTLNDPFDAQADYLIAEQGGMLRATICRFFEESGASPEMAASFALDGSLDDPKALEASLKANHQLLLGQLGICSLAAERNDMLLWTHYAQNHRGLAVQYRPSLDPEAFQVMRMEYNDDYPVIRNFFDRRARDLLSPLLRKASKWSYEEEWRIFRPDAPNRMFQVHPESVTGVLVGMRIADSDRDYIRSIVIERDRRFGTRTAIYQAEQVPGAYCVRMRRLP